MELPSLPRRRADVRLVVRTVRLVLGQPLYFVIGITSALIALTGLVVSQNLALVFDLVLGGDLSLTARLYILVQQYPFVGPGFTTVQGLLVLGVSLLVGIDLALLSYHVREHSLSAREGSSGVAGVTLGVIGAGCAACGPAIVVGVLSLVGAASLSTVIGAVESLPLDGLEFGLAAAVLLVLSIYWIADGMRGGQIQGCPVDPGS